MKRTKANSESGGSCNDAAASSTESPKKRQRMPYNPTVSHLQNSPKLANRISTSLCLENNENKSKYARYVSIFRINFLFHSLGVYCQKQTSSWQSKWYWSVWKIVKFNLIKVLRNQSVGWIRLVASSSWRTPRRCSATCPQAGAT